MTGSLARLVLRAQGRLPVAQPLLPSRYAAAAPPAGLQEATGAEPIEAGPIGEPAPPRRDLTPARPAIPSDPTFPVPTDPPTPRAASPLVRSDMKSEASGRLPASEPPGTISIVASRSVGRVEDDAPGTPARPAPIAPEPARAAPPLDHATRSRPSDRAAVPSPPAAVPGEAVSRDLDRRPSPGVSPVLARPAALGAARAAIAEAPRPGAPAPDVRISIGRVEVHAAPARPAPARVVPARHPALSLADYLARRR